MAESAQITPSALKDALTRIKLRQYQPYPKQREFHSLGAYKRERCLLAGNQCGKTLGAGMEASAHTTGRYPEWWEGIVYPGPIKMWAANTNNETTRDNPQRILLGDFYSQGTGTIPGVDIVKVINARGIADQVDRMIIRHQSGGYSQVQFKAYDQRREKWQGETIDLMWLDEEPPGDVYTEALARISKGQYGMGRLMLTETPLLGMSSVVGFFYPKPSTKDRALVQMDISDALHFSEAEREQIIDGYPAHEKEARTKGLPMLGSGRIFPISEESILEDPIESIPSFWPRLIGIDFGWEHPTAGAAIAWDRDADCMHLYHEYRESQQTTVVHAAAFKAFGGDRIPIAWPQDAYQMDKQSGVSTADAYRRAGLNMLPMHSTFEAGGYGVEAGIAQMLARMQTGRFKVSRLCVKWLNEFRSYHRKKGRVVKENDDLLDASRQVEMMIRFSATDEPSRLPLQVGLDFDPLQPLIATSDRGIYHSPSYDPFDRRH